MGIETKVECDYAGYCYRRDVKTVDGAKQNKWLQVIVNGNTLTIEPFDGSKPDAAIACPDHAEEVAAGAVGRMDMFKPQAIAEEPNA